MTTEEKKELSSYNKYIQDHLFVDNKDTKNSIEIIVEIPDNDKKIKKRVKKLVEDEKIDNEESTEEDLLLNHKESKLDSYNNTYIYFFAGMIFSITTTTLIYLYFR